MKRPRKKSSLAALKRGFKALSAEEKKHFLIYIEAGTRPRKWAIK